MNKPVQPNADKPKTRWGRVTIAVVFGGLLIGAGVKIFAHNTPGLLGSGYCGFGATDPEARAKRADAMVRFMLSKVDASEAQQATIAGIVQAAMTDLGPLRDKHAQAHKVGAELLSQPSIDRAALESLRTEQMQLAEAASQRIAQVLADAAEVLTPEQRTELVGRVERIRSAHRW